MSDYKSDLFTQREQDEIVKISGGGGSDFPDFTKRSTCSNSVGASATWDETANAYVFTNTQYDLTCNFKTGVDVHAIDNISVWIEIMCMIGTTPTTYYFPCAYDIASVSTAKIKLLVYPPYIPIKAALSSISIKANVSTF